MSEDHESKIAASDDKAFVVVMAGTVLLAAFAIGLSLALKTPLAPQMAIIPNDVLIGVIATLPLALFLWWFSTTTNPTLAAFRYSQIKFFAEIGFEFTPLRIVLMAIGAGVSEELLFRGVLQSWIGSFAPIAIAIIVSNIVFGMLHMRTVLYAVIAGLVGVYLGVLYAFNGNLLAPIITHGLYDFIALIYTRRAVAQYCRDHPNAAPS